MSSVINSIKRFFPLKTFNVNGFHCLHQLFERALSLAYITLSVSSRNYNSISPSNHHCVVIFFWSSGIMECTRMLFTFENGVPLMRKGASVVWHHSLLVMNSFNKTEAAVFSCRLCFLRAFPLITLI